MVFSVDLRLDAHDLALARGGRRLAEGLAFSLKGGEALLVTGPNGAGKSTFLRVLAGLLAPASGSLTLRGAGVEAPGQAAHYLGHAEALKGALTARENLEFWSAMLAMGDQGLDPRAALERSAAAPSTAAASFFLSPPPVRSTSTSPSPPRCSCRPRPRRGSSSC